MNYRKYLDPEIISRLARMDLRAKLVVEGFIVGLHKSPYHGFSVEFAEHRKYTPGDPIKHIDWKVYAKSDRYYIKEFEEETNLKAYILMDASGSMGYLSESAKGINKLQYGSYLAAALTYLMLRQQDAVGLVTFDTDLRQYIPPRTHPTHLHLILKELENLEAKSDTDVSITFHQLAEKIKRRGLIIIISDLLDEPDKVLSALKHFRHKKNEVIVFHILDEYEIKFPFSNEAIFKDLETGEEILTQPWEIRKAYREAMQEFIDYYKLHCRQSLIDYVPITTSTPYDKALLAYLNKRKMLG